MSKKAIIIGAGPAGLTAAYELLKRTDIKPIILEKSGDIGGISKTINYKGNRMDIGGHRFFSKSDRVMQWWLNIMPLQKSDNEKVTINYQNKEHSIYTNTNQGAGEPVNPGRAMLIRKRLSRIYFLRQFFNYPIQLSLDTLRKLGFVRTIRILLSYLVAHLMPRKPEKSLEDFLINRFGRELYKLFFKDYTEKVWGVPCNEISAEWGAQRIKGVSISKAMQHAAQTMFKRKNSHGDISQKSTETSLIEQFLYPALGPGQLWEEVARKIEVLGGTILMYQDVKEIKITDRKVTSVIVVDSQSGETTEHEGNYFFSTMPVQELIAGINGSVPDNVKEVAAGLQYRDFITVGVLLEQLSTTDIKTGEHKPLDLKDTWIYIQEKDVKVGRLQLFNNWSPYMVQQPGTVWIGMEYFCNKGDDFWKLSDEEIKRSAISELEKMGLAQVSNVLDCTIHRIEKTYPAYFGTYNQFDKIRAFTDMLENLFLVGRNGMHKYNNSDHSMLTAMTAVDNICEGATTKDNIWAINTEMEYHEEKTKEIPVERKVQPVALHQAETSFFDFIWRNKWNRFYVIISLVAFLIQFVAFKFYYPYANYMPDSYSYLEAAAYNLDVNMWPVAYSKFLRIFSAFSHSDKMLTGFQYLLMNVSGIVFVFTLLYFLNPARWVKFTLLMFFIFNPVTLYVSNYISADALFISFSLIWLTQLLWIVYRPKGYMIISQAFLLLILFTLRYNALYYPVVAALAFIISRQKMMLKLSGIALGCTLILFSIFYTSNKMQEVTGQKQFSAFGGWQLANNALYMYEHIPSKERKPVPVRFAKLEKIVRHSLDTQNKDFVSKKDSMQGYYYLWSDKSPLNQFMLSVWDKDTTTSYFRRWSSVAPLYTDYALYLIRHYPLEYGKGFLLPNSVRFVVPPTEFVGIYNMGFDSVKRLAQEWFNYKSQQVKKNNKMGAGKIKFIQIYPVASAIINTFLLICTFGLLFFSGFNFRNIAIDKILLLVLFMWILNFSFSVFASSIVLRYQVFPMMVSFSLAIIVAENIYKLGLKKATL